MPPASRARSLVGDALNATGCPSCATSPCSWSRDRADIELVGDLDGAGTAAVEDAVRRRGGRAASATPGSEAPLRAVAAPGLGIDSFSTGLGTLVLLGISSVGVALARRQRAQRAFRGPDRRPARGHRTARSGTRRGAGSGPRTPPSAGRSGPERAPNSAQTCVDRLDAAGIGPLCSIEGARRTSVTQAWERAFADRGCPRRDPHRRAAVPHRARPGRAGRLHPPPRRPGPRRARSPPISTTSSCDAPPPRVRDARPARTGACASLRCRPGSAPTTSRS